MILLAEHEGSRWLDDTTGAGVFNPSYNSWLRDVLLPPLVAAGLKRFAFVMPESFGDAQLESIGTKLAVEGLEVKAFNRRAKAEAWIQRS